MLIEQIESLRRNSEITQKVVNRLKEFEELSKKDDREWFSELCFCILTANSKAKTAISIQKELGFEGFSKLPEDALKECILRNKHRFHNNKAKYITEARKYVWIKNILSGKTSSEAREFLANKKSITKVKGLGYKEASHFLRNVGYTDVAILDRHILNLMFEEGLIDDVKTPNDKKYLEIEEKFKQIAGDLGMNCAELDLYMWYLKTNEILK